MKKKATSQSAFFNLRLLVGLFVALVGVSLLALGALATANPAGRGAPVGTNACIAEQIQGYDQVLHRPTGPCDV